MGISLADYQPLLVRINNKYSTQYVWEAAQMLTRQSTIHGKYHGNTGYLLENVDVGTQEFVGMGNHVDDGQMTWTDELQMLTSHRGRTSQSHK